MQRVWRWGGEVPGTVAVWWKHIFSQRWFGAIPFQMVLYLQNLKASHSFLLVSLFPGDLYMRFFYFCVCSTSFNCLFCFLRRWFLKNCLVDHHYRHQKQQLNYANDAELNDDGNAERTYSDQASAATTPFLSILYLQHAPPIPWFWIRFIVVAYTLHLNILQRWITEPCPVLAMPPFNMMMLRATAIRII